jgi:hypothetical protein
VIEILLPATKEGVAVPVPPLTTGSADPDKPTANVPLEVTGEPDTDKNAGTVIATDVTVPPPPPPEELTVWLGHVPEMVTFVPATKEGVVVPEPPLATGKTPDTFVVRLANVVALVPVPPLAIGSTPDTSVVNTNGLLTILTKSEPFHATNARAPDGIVTPAVGPEPRTTIEPVPELITK